MQSRATRTFLALSFAAALLALAFATFNAIELAGQALVAAMPLAACAGIAAIYPRLPEDARHALWARCSLRRAAIASLALAILISCTYWFVGYYPWDVKRWPRFMLEHWGDLDYVPSAFALLLPTGWKSGFHRYFTGRITYCFPGPPWWETMRYLRAAIPGYFLFFFVTIAFARLGFHTIIRWLPRRGR
jgi:hypothetical protein